ncbi:ribonuclease H [Senna tora]|uniref:Ribonuclease H n=1 Tax=Senna tora TaxID=362788 RepID=A0A835CGU8_9FABA|nr:ribonuclease H [Senna tora]
MPSQSLPGHEYPTATRGTCRRIRSLEWNTSFRYLMIVSTTSIGKQEQTLSDLVVLLRRRPHRSFVVILSPEVRGWVNPTPFAFRMAPHVTEQGLPRPELLPALATRPGNLGRAAGFWIFGGGGGFLPMLGLQVNVIVHDCDQFRLPLLSTMLRLLTLMSATPRTIGIGVCHYLRRKREKKNKVQCFFLRLRGIQKTWKYVEKGLVWQVGHGKRIRFWEDRWLKNGERISDLMTIDPNVNMNQDLLCDFVAQNGDWDWGKLEEVINADILEELSRMKGNRVRILDGRRSGSEDGLHVVRDCCEARKLWFMLVPGNEWDQFFSLELEEWIDKNLNNSFGEGCRGDWSITFGVACWILWKRRNTRVFGGKYAFQGNVAIQVLAVAETFSLGFRGIENLQGSCRIKEVLVSWKAPALGWWKLNVDGAFVREINSGGCGGVLRDDIGGWIWGFYRFLGQVDVLTAELWGCFHGLSLAWEKGVKVWLESDSLNAVKLISMGCRDEHRCAGLVKLIRNLLDRDWETVVSHSFRESNFVADWCAGQAVKTRSPWYFWERMPAGVELLVLADRRGIMNPRRVVDAD